MVHHSKLYSERIKRDNMISYIPPGERFMISGKGEIFGLEKNIASLTPISDVKNLVLPFDINDIVDIYCGYHIVYFITKYDIYSTCDHTVKNSGRILNINSIHSFDKITLPNGIHISPSVSIKKISTGDDHTMILLNNGILICFGLNADGQLGIGRSDEMIALPTLVDPSLFGGKKIIDVSCGYYHTIVLTEDRAIYTAGRNKGFQTGVIRNRSNINDEENFKSVNSFTKINTNISDNEIVVKIMASSHNSSILTNRGILYGLGRNTFHTFGTQTYTIFTPIEPFYSLGNYVIDIWCTTLGSFVKLNNGDIYMAGQDDQGSLFNIPASDIMSYTKNNFLSGKNIGAIHGLYTILAIDENKENLYMSGNNDRRQIKNINCHIVTNYKNEKISKIIKMKSYLNVNIRGGFRTCSVSMTKKDGYTKNLCELYSNLYSCVFDDKNILSDISFQFI